MRIFPVLILVISLFISACSPKEGIYKHADFSTNKKILEDLNDISEKIYTIKATMKLIPSVTGVPSIDAFMGYRKNGPFRLTGLSPTGLILFNFELENDNFTLYIYGRGKISNQSRENHLKLSKRERHYFPEDPSIIREIVFFHGVEESGENFFYIENVDGYYVLNQLRIRNEFLYPVRRWWMDEKELKIRRKEIYSTGPGREGEKMYEILYNRFKQSQGIWMPFDIEIKDSEGKEILRLEIEEIRYKGLSPN